MPREPRPRCAVCWPEKEITFRGGDVIADRGGPHAPLRDAVRGWHAACRADYRSLSEEGACDAHIIGFTGGHPKGMAT